jgi:hypothetical protein
MPKVAPPGPSHVLDTFAPYSSSLHDPLTGAGKALPTLVLYQARPDSIPQGSPVPRFQVAGTEDIADYLDGECGRGGTLLRTELPDSKEFIGSVPTAPTVKAK